jgi:hypothetical protein
MKTHHRMGLLALASAVVVGVLVASSPAAAQKFAIKSIAEKKVLQLPPGPLFWRIDNFATLAQAQAEAGPTALAAEAVGKVWLFTLGAKGGSSPDGTKVAEVGPVPPFSAREYLLRINSASGAPGAKTPVHTHPGSESFYVLTGELSQKTRASRTAIKTATMRRRKPQGCRSFLAARIPSLMASRSHK